MAHWKSLPVGAAAISLLLLLPACTVGLAIPLTRIGSAGQTCCTPDQWETRLGYVFGGAVPYSSAYGSVSYDYTNQLLAQNQTFITTDGKALSQRLLMVGKTKKMYMIDGASGRCISSDMPTGIPKQCVPSYFNRVTTITFGDPSAGLVNAQVFQATITGGVNITLLMSQENCVPLSQTAMQPGNTLSIQSFFNLTGGIKDPSVFNVPAACQSRFAEQDNSLARLLLQRSRRSAKVDSFIISEPFVPTVL